MKQSSFDTELEKLKQNRQFFVIFALLFVCVVFWAVVSVFNSQQQSVISPELQEKALPLNPTISEAVLEQLEQERTYSEEELAEFTIYRLLKRDDGSGQLLLPLGSDVALSSPAPRASASASPTPAPAATNSGVVTP